MKQKSTLMAKTLRKKKILLSTLISVGCLAIVTTVAVPVVLTQCIPTKYTIDGENWKGYKSGAWTLDDYQVDSQNKTITYVDKGVNKNYTAKNLVIPSKVIYDGEQYSVIIGHEAFSQSTGVKLSGSLTISEGVTSIGDYAFDGCSGLNGVLKIPNSVTSIGRYAFFGCSNLIESGSITPNKISCGADHVYYIFNGTSYYCLGRYQNVTDSGTPPSGPLSLQNDTKVIADQAFYGCSELIGALTIKSHVISVGNYAFYGCPKLTGTLTIMNSVTSIGDFAFAYCSGLTGTLTIPDSVTSIGDNAFNSCSKLTGDLTIPNSITSIGSQVFRGCSGFNGILTIGNNVTSIGYQAFYNCSNLTGDLSIPDDVTTIKSSAFSGCSGLNGILKIPNSVTSIGPQAFYDCSGLIDNTDPIVPNKIFHGDDNVYYIFNGTWYYCLGRYQNVTDSGTPPSGPLSLQNDTRVIADYAFRDCLGLNGALTIKSHVISVGNYAFYNCSNFDGDLRIPDSVTTIGNRAFYDCTGLDKILTIGNSVTSIGDRAFFNCYNLMGPLTIGDSVTSIGEAAFSQCFDLAGVLKISNSVTFIGNYAFAGCSKLIGDLIIPDNLTFIGDYVFGNCSKLTGDLTIPNSVTSIGIGAFWNCSSLTGKLSIPNSVTSIGDRAFWDCSRLTGALTIPSSVTSIGAQAFENCPNLTSIDFPNSVTSIGAQAFYGCSNLIESGSIAKNKISCGADNVYYIFNGTWYYCLGRYQNVADSGTPLSGSLSLQNNTKVIADQAFYDCSVLSFDLTNFSGFYGFNWIFGCSSLRNIYISERTSSAVNDTFDNGWNDVGPAIGCELYAPDESIANTFRENIIVGLDFTEAQASKWISRNYDSYK